MPRASIVVRCYNEAEHIGRLLHGIAEQTIQDTEVILVDSGSTDGTLEVAREHGVDDIVYIDPEAFSFGRALNYGCEAASGEFCVVASAHVYPRRDDWLERLLEPFDDRVALVYGKQRGNEVTTYAERRTFEQWFPEHDIEYQAHPFCNNANAAIRRELWTEHPYDEDLAGLEDVAWAQELQATGYEVSYAADAEVVHVHDETAREIYNRYRREAYAHKQLFPGHSFSVLDFLRLSAAHVLSDYRAAVADGAFWSNVLEIPTFRLLQFFGTYRGFARDGPVSEGLWQRFYYPDRDSYPSRAEADGSTVEGATAADEGQQAAKYRSAVEGPPTGDRRNLAEPDRYRASDSAGDTAAHVGTDTAAHGGTETAAHGGTDTAARVGTDTAARVGTDTRTRAEEASDSPSVQPSDGRTTRGSPSLAEGDTEVWTDPGPTRAGVDVDVDDGAVGDGAVGDGAVGDGAVGDGGESEGAEIDYPDSVGAGDVGSGRTT